MKKFSIAAVMMLLCASAYAAASSLSVPWYVDNLDPANNGATSIYAPKKAGVAGLVILKSNSTEKLVCSIAYYNSTGDFLGPIAPNNTFAIQALSSVSFRPVWQDSSQESGPSTQEGTGLSVPGRPRSVDASTPIPGSVKAGTANTPVIDTKFNGALSVTWEGAGSLVQGFVNNFNTVFDSKGDTIAYSYGTLLPPGV